MQPKVMGVTMAMMTKDRLNHIAKKPQRSWYSINAKHEAEPAEVLIYDEIGFLGISADGFVKDFADIKSDSIHLHINSPGGSVFEGNAIFNAIKKHPAHVTTHIDGLAASIASIIALAGDEVVMAKNAFMMIHDPWAFVIGNAADLRKEADVMDKIGESLAQTYVDKTGKKLSEIKQLMADETWFNADEAKDLGLADSITGEGESEVAAKFDLSIFNHAPSCLCGQGTQNNKPETERDFERVLRDAGFSRTEAKAMTARCFDGGQRDADEGNLGLPSEILTEIRNNWRL